MQRLDDRRGVRLEHIKNICRNLPHVAPKEAGPPPGDGHSPAAGLTGASRQAVISAMTQGKPAGPVYHACQIVTSAIDALAQLLTGSPHYFHAQGSLGAPGEPVWSRDRSTSESGDG
jgi:hypothetical protein